MKNHYSKDLILQLIHRDLKHAQLVDGIQRLGFETDKHNLQLWELVATLMEIDPSEISNQWFDTYMRFLDKAFEYPISIDSGELWSLAEQCYDNLMLLSEGL